MRGILKQLLFHFILMGAGLFALYEWVGSRAERAATNLET